MAYASDTQGIADLLAAGGDYDADSTVTDTALGRLQTQATYEVNAVIASAGFVPSALSSGTVAYQTAELLENVTAALLAVDSGQFNVEQRWYARHSVRRNDLAKRMAAVLRNTGAQAAAAANVVRVGSMVNVRQSQESVTETFSTASVRVS